MGAWLAGDKSAVLMQSSGVGNIINMLATIKECRFPLLMLVTMRGDEGEFNPWQVPMGQATRAVLEAMGVVVKRIDTAEDAEPVVERRGAPCLQQLRRRGRAHRPAPHRHQELPGPGQPMKPTLHRRDVVKALLADRGELLVITGLGSTAWDATAAGDHDLTFPLWGAMGGAVMIGLGLALAKPRRRVLVLTGDGEMLMGLGSLATDRVCKSLRTSVRRGHRQRALRRDRHAEDAHCGRRRPRRDRQRVAGIRAGAPGRARRAASRACARWCTRRPGRISRRSR